jgi:hypothetical protein
LRIRDERQDQGYQPRRKRGDREDETRYRDAPVDDPQPPREQSEQGGAGEADDLQHDDDGAVFRIEGRHRRRCRVLVRQ